MSEVLNTSEGPVLEVKISSIESLESAHSGGLDGFFGWHAHGFALVNGDMKQALAMTQHQRSGRGSALVLPGVQVYESTMQFRAVDHFFKPDSVRVSQQWLDRAELRVAEWIPVGSYPVEIGPPARAGGTRIIAAGTVSSDSVIARP